MLGLAVSGRVLRVSLHKREREVASTFARTGGKGSTYDAAVGAKVSFSVPPIRGLDGVLRVTVADAASGLNLAERCVSSQHAKSLHAGQQRLQGPAPQPPLAVLLLEKSTNLCSVSFVRLPNNGRCVCPLQAGWEGEE